MSRRELKSAARELAAQGEDAETVITTLAPRCPSELVRELPRIADLAVRNTPTATRTP